MPRRGAVVRVVAVLGVVLALVTQSALADVFATDFESYSLGPIWGQNGWTGQLCFPPDFYDIEVADNSLHAGAPMTFGSKSYRISNENVSGCFDDSFSPSLADEAGESSAANGGFSGGTRQRKFVTQLTFASSTGGVQPGLAVQFSPDRGDGARMSYIRMRHTATDLAFDFFDVQGTVGTPPCFQCANFVQKTFGGYNPSVPHTVRLEMIFRDGPSNDIVRVYIDGLFKHRGGSWEDYYYFDTESSPNPPRVSRTVDSILIRASGSATASVAGAGFLIDDVFVASGPTTCNEDASGAHETGVLSGPIHNSVEPIIPPARSTIHDINCDVVVPLGL